MLVGCIRFKLQEQVHARQGPPGNCGQLGFHDGNSAEQRSYISTSLRAIKDERLRLQTEFKIHSLLFDAQMQDLGPPTSVGCGLPPFPPNAPFPPLQPTDNFPMAASNSTLYPNSGQQQSQQISQSNPISSPNYPPFLAQATQISHPNPISTPNYFLFIRISLPTFLSPNAM